jgi:alpha-ketoglutarate-dependent taurine dioxygenase
MGGMTQFEELDLDPRARAGTSAEEIAAACRRAHLVLIRPHTHAAGDCSFWNDILGSSGLERVAVDEDPGTGKALDNLWSNVEFDPDRQNRFRHSRSAQPLHTDGSYVPESPTLMMMFCAKSAPEGGATLFLDGEDLVRLLAEERETLFGALCEIPMVFRKGTREVRAPVIARDAHGPVLRWNYYALSDELEPGARAVAEEFQAFVLDITRRSIPLALRLEPGDAVVFHDYRVLHGRESFQARVAGERLLWKGGLELRCPH